MIKTVNGSVLLNTKALNGLIASDLNGYNSIHLPKTFTKEDISAVEEDVPMPELTQRWSHPKRIQDQLPPRLPGAKVGLLIGSNCPKALQPMDIVASQNGGPFTVKTFAGWVIVGPLYMCNKEHSTVNCNRVATKEIGSQRSFDHHFTVEDRVTPQVFNEILELDFSKRSKGKEHEYSLEDRKFQQIVNEGVKRTDDNHYEIPLPFRLPNVRFPDNREQVLHTAYWQKKKLTRKGAFYKDYVNFISDIIAKGYARKVSSDRLTTDMGKVWYIPHHGVYHSKKPKKTRVVFDCSTRFGGTSLNYQLIQGPDLTNTLVGVLTRFCQKLIAFIADIVPSGSSARGAKRFTSFFLVA